MRKIGLKMIMNCMRKQEDDKEEGETIQEFS